MLPDGLANGTEDDTLFAQFFLEGGLHADAVHDGIDGGIAAEGQALLQGDAQLVEGLLQFRVYPSGNTAGHRLCRGVGVIRNGLIVNGGHMHVSPCGLRLFLPIAECLQTELKHPFGFPLLGRDEPNDILVQPLLNDFSMYVRGEAKLIFLFGHLADKLVSFFHQSVFGLQKYEKKSKSTDVFS